MGHYDPELASPIEKESDLLVLLKTLAAASVVYVVRQSNSNVKSLSSNPKLGLALAVSIMWMTRQSVASHDDETQQEKDYARRVTALRDDRLVSCIKSVWLPMLPLENFTSEELEDVKRAEFDLECVGSTSAESQVLATSLEPLLGLIDDVACCTSDSKLLRASYGVMRVALDLKLRCVNDETVPLVYRDELTPLLEHLERRNVFVRRKVARSLRSSLLVAKTRMRRRRFEQAYKIAHLLRRAKSQAPLILLSTGLSALCGSLDGLREFYKASIVELAIRRVTSSSASTTSMTKTTIDLIKAEILFALASVASEQAVRVGQREFVLNLKSDLMRSLLEQDVSFFERKDVWELRSLIGSASIVSTSLFDVPMRLVRDAARIYVSAKALWEKSWRLFVVTTSLNAIQFTVERLVDALQEWLESGRLRPYEFKDLWTALVHPRGLRTLRSFGREPFELEQFVESTKAFDKQSDRVGFLYRLTSPLKDLSQRVATVSAFTFGASLVSSTSTLKPSELATFVSTSANVFDQTYFAYNACTSLVDSVFDPMEKMYDVLESTPKIGLTKPPYAESLKRLSDQPLGLEFDAVSFAYPLKPSSVVLRTISFVVEPGSRVGLLGSSGCGKSTLFALIERMYDPTHGTVRVGGLPLCEINPLFLRRRVCSVSQDSYLPCSTIMENLVYGRFDDAPTVQEIHDALRLCDCEFFFSDSNRFPEGLHSDVGRDGSKLSGGEKQRLALARALLSRPSILLLDEHSSALDELSQRRVQAGLETYHARFGTTMVSIAHRLSNFRGYDWLVVLGEGGVVLEAGTPKELSAKEHGAFRAYVDTHIESVDF